MSGKLVVKQAFGVNPLVKNCLSYTEDHHLAYVCGHQVAVINSESKEQNFIAATSTYQHQSLGITAIVTAASKKIIAVAEKVEPAAIVTFYDSHTLRKKKLLVNNDLGSNEIKCIAFSEDGRYLITQGCGPEWNLVLWNVEKSMKVICSVKISVSDDTPVNEVSFCPWDPNVIIVLGKSILRVFRFVENQLRPITLTVRRDQANFISHCWLPEDSLILGTEHGELLYVESLEFRGVIATSSPDHDKISPILCLNPTPRGFVMGTKYGELRLFERHEDIKEKYQQEDVCMIPGDTGDIVEFAMGPDEVLVCATDRRQLLSISLTNLNNMKEGTGGFDHVLTGFHSPNGNLESSITGIDVALWKQIVVTCGKDKTVRVWNCQDRKLELVKEFEEEPISLSVHPSGMYIAVAFPDRIRILSILLEELNQCREIHARQCSLIKFSRGGQYIASANGTNLQIYGTFNGAPCGTLRGHNNKINSIIWMNNDSKLMTVGSDGVVHNWDLFPVSRKPEHFSGSIPISAGAGPMDGSHAYIATNDKLVKDLQYNTGRDLNSRSGLTTAASDPDNHQLSHAHGLQKDVKVASTLDLGFFATCMLYDETRRMILIGTCSEDVPGAVVCTLTSPSLSQTGMEVNSIHSSPVTAMCQSYDGNHIYSADTNGCLIVSEFENAAFASGKGASKAREGVTSFEFIDEVMIHKTDLETRKAEIKRLTLKVEELNQNNEHQLRLKELEHKDKLTEITEKSTGQLQSEKMKYDELESEKQGLEKEFGKKVKNLENVQVDELRAIETKYKLKRNTEETRYKILKEETEEAHRRWNEENQTLVESHQKYLQELTVEYEEKLLSEQSAQKDILHGKEQLHVQYDSLKNDTETDGDREIAEMKIRYDEKLKQEEETALQLMAQHVMMTKHHETLTKDSNQQKVEIKRLKDKEARLYETIQSLEKDIQSHKKEIREREETITDKEKRIFDLKKKNQELEKFRFVLDYKIKELKLQIAPRENEINTMKTQIGEMAIELEQYKKSNQALTLMIEELKLKLDGVRTELDEQQQRCLKTESLLEKFRQDLQELWNLRDDQTAFKANMIKMYRIYVQEDFSPSMTNGKSGSDLEDPQQAYNRDREQMERSLDSLRRAIKAEALAHKRDLGKMMRESVLLTKELNNLRKNARSLQLQKKAIDQAGELNLNSNLVELMELLGLQLKKPAPGISSKNSKNEEKTGDKNMQKTYSQTVTLAPLPPGMDRRRDGPSRSAALKLTTAEGKMTNKTPQGNSIAMAKAGATGTSMLSRHDQWEAWREIQIQYDQMKLLEEQLTAVCHSLGIDAIPVIVRIDTSLETA